METIWDLLKGYEVLESYDDAMEMMRASNYQSIVNSIKRKIPSSKCHLYGSRMMGIALEDADLDVFIDISEKQIIPRSKLGY
jgi:DNA polymerase sigma